MSIHYLGAAGKIFIVCLYINDLIFTGNDSVMFEDFKKSDGGVLNDGSWYGALFSRHGNSAIY
jgi:hypothetical protein